MEKYSDSYEFLQLMAFAEKQQAENPNFAYDFFVSQGGTPILITCDSFRDLYNEAETLCRVKAKVIAENGVVITAGKTYFNILKKQDICELQTISVDDIKVSHVGIGSHMLQMMEQTAQNYSIRHIAGVFSPFNERIANAPQVASFYKKNGYGLCEYKDEILLYKNFDGSYNTKPQLSNEDYILTDDYKNYTIKVGYSYIDTQNIDDAIDEYGIL